MQNSNWIKLPLNVERQDKAHHCWASVIKGVLDLIDFDNTLSQDDIASKILGEDNNKFQKPDEVMKYFGILRERVSSLINWDQLTAEINKGLPVVARVDWAFGGGHLVAISGFSTSKEIHIDDPLYGPAIVLYSEFCDNYLNFGSWSHSYLVKK